MLSGSVEFRCEGDLVAGPGDFVLLPEPGPIDPAPLAHAAQHHAIELLGPPPGR